MYLLYGIKNCDKVTAARKWLDAKNIEFQFIDIRSDPVAISDWSNWIDFFGIDKLVNRRSTTWKQLPDSTKQNFTESVAIELLQKHPTLMKRPLMTFNGNCSMIGFSNNQYSEYFNR